MEYWGKIQGCRQEFAGLVPAVDSSGAGVSRRVQLGTGQLHKGAREAGELDRRRRQNLSAWAWHMDSV